MEDVKNSKETILYQTKIKPIGAILLFLVFGAMGVQLMIQTLSAKEDKVYVLGGLSICLLAYALFNGWKMVKELTNTKFHIKITPEGLETNTTAFEPWNSIKNLKITTDTSRKHFVYLLEYTFPGGREKLKINNISMTPVELEKLINSYKKKEDMENFHRQNSTNNGNQNKDKMIEDFFNKK